MKAVEGEKTWLRLIVTAAVIMMLVPSSTHAATLRELLNKQSDLQKQAEESRKKLEQKKKEATNLQETIENLNDDISYTESRITNTVSQISLTNKVIEELNSDINQTQEALNQLKNRLRTAYIHLYELSRTSSLEILLESDSISDAISQAQYIQALQDSLQKDIAKANDIMAELNSKKAQTEEQKKSLEQLNRDLNNQKISLNRKRNQKSFLLGATQGEQARYEELLKKLEKEQEKLSKEIYEARRKMGSGEVFSGGTGGYPWANESNPYAVDPWLFYKRQCVSYAAWRFQMVFGNDFYNTRPGEGSAWNWPTLARDQGYKTSSTARVNSVVSWPRGTNMPYGHVAWVTAVNNDGTIDVAEYNWVSERNYSERRFVDPYRYGSPTYIYP